MVQMLLLWGSSFAVTTWALWFRATYRSPDWFCLSGPWSSSHLACNLQLARHVPAVTHYIWDKKNIAKAAENCRHTECPGDVVELPCLDKERPDMTLSAVVWLTQWCSVTVWTPSHCLFQPSSYCEFENGSEKQVEAFSAFILLNGWKGTEWGWFDYAVGKRIPPLNEGAGDQGKGCSSASLGFWRLHLTWAEWMQVEFIPDLLIAFAWWGIQSNHFSWNLE